MNVYKLTEQQVAEWVERLISASTVYGVQQRHERFVFAPLKRAGDLRLDYDVTILPPKKFFLPTKEEILAFQSPEKYRSLWPQEPFVLLGVHPYDFVAIRQLDQLFARDNCDEHYLTRRRLATIVVSDVQRVSENVFAGCVNTAVVNEGFDGLLTLIGDAYLLELCGEKGESLGAALPVRQPATAADLAERHKVWEENQQRLRRHQLKVPLEKIGQLLQESYEHPVWEEKAGLCYSCGSCNLVCPTCYCFDVRDETDWSLQSGVRYRTWDGCLLQDFAVVAGGHNFRASRAARYRHRYYRKGLYVPEVIGELACVGCGRCVTACTAKIANPVEIYNRLQEEPYHDSSPEQD